MSGNNTSTRCNDPNNLLIPWREADMHGPTTRHVVAQPCSNPRHTRQEWDACDACYEAWKADADDYAAATGSYEATCPDCGITIPDIRNLTQWTDLAGQP